MSTQLPQRVEVRATHPRTPRDTLGTAAGGAYAAARPLLVLLASVPQEATPKKEKKVVRLPEGPLGLRLADARLKDGAPVARVARVAPGGRAWKGGVVVGDVLAVVDGDNVAGYAHALALLADRRPCAATFEFRGDALDVVAAAPAAPASLLEKLKAPAAELARNLAADLETLKADLTPSKEEPPPPSTTLLPQVSSPPPRITEAAGPST